MEEQFIIQIGPDLANVLSDSEILRQEVESELQKQGIKAQVKWEGDPRSTKPERDLVLLVLTIGASSMMVMNGVKRVIDARNRGKITVVTERTTTRGTDDRGQPFSRVEETPHVYGPCHESDSTGLKVWKIFEFSSSTGPRDEPSRSEDEPAREDETGSSSGEVPTSERGQSSSRWDERPRGTEQGKST